MFGGVNAVWTPQDEDIVFHGYPPYSVQVELKRSSTDLVRSLTNGHLSAQLVRGRERGYNIQMVAAYGEFDKDPASGLARHRIYGARGKSYMARIDPEIKYNTMMRRLYTILINQRVMFIHDISLRGACDQITEWYWWWQAPPEKHTSDQTPYAGAAYLSGDVPITVRVAKELPGVGIKRAMDVGEHFDSVEEMVGAGESEWRMIPGIGEVTAKGIVNKEGWKKVKER